MLSKEEAIELIRQYISNQNKIKHMLAVAAMMKELAKRFGEDVNEWELVGLLHDLDYDLTQNERNKHGLIAANMLKGKLKKESLHAIQAHDHRTGLKPKTLIDKALIASDCIWGLIIRTAVSTKSRKADQIKLTAMKNKLKAETFPKFLRKGILMCKEINLTLEEFFRIALNSLPKQLTIDGSDLMEEPT
jgi:putative nucleotidyltransferase with HDIG domain